MARASTVNSSSNSDNAMLDNIKNYRQIDNKLHTSAQPDAEQLLQLKKAGIDIVINLAHDQSPGAVADEAERIASQGIPYINIPVDFQQPRHSDFQLFAETMDKHANDTTLVHCAYNWRVSAFVYLYRVLCRGVEREQAEQDMLAIWQPDDTWQTFIEACMANQKHKQG